MQFSHNETDDVMSEINMTPLVDVMLVLLIIFIIAMPVVQHSIRLSLPQASTQVQQVPPVHVNVSVDAAGNVFWNNQPVPLGELENLSRQAAQNPQTQLHVRADKTTTYQQIASVMAAIQNAGVQKVALVTVPH